MIDSGDGDAGCGCLIIVILLCFICYQCGKDGANHKAAGPIPAKESP